MLSLGKFALLKTAGATGLMSLVAASRWRARRLLILGYHGISLDSEHAWQPWLYLRQDTLRRRMAWLHKHRYTILPLAEGVERLKAGTLPARAVALTFDDGFYDFLAGAYPVLEEFSAPATLYLSTWHTSVSDPVPGLMLRYLLWKGRAAVPGAGPPWQLESDSAREALATGIEAEVGAEGAGYAGWRTRLPAIAARLGIDYESILASRLLQFMRPDEVASLDPHLVTVQLHTHRHRVPRDETLFQREIVDNRAALRGMLGTDHQADHFCYPNGEHYPDLLPWLRAAGIHTAVTCVPGLATRRSHPLLLPRHLDGDAAPDAQFAAWASGVSELLPRRRVDPRSGAPYR